MPYMDSQMSFSIEASSETNPLNHQNLLSTLSQASSSSQQQIQVGTQQLQNWEHQPQFHSSLQDVLLNSSLPFQVRYLSAIQLKNGIDRYWRKTAANAISKEEKATIRSRCLEAILVEPDHRLALQLSLVMAKITRVEFPHDWPDAFSSVTRHLRSAVRAESNPLLLPRALLVLLYMIKELASGKLQRIRVNLQSTAPEVFEPLLAIYSDRVQRWMSSLQHTSIASHDTMTYMEQSLLSLRVIRRLLIFGYENHNRHSEVCSFWSLIKSQFGEMLPFVLQQNEVHVHNIHTLVERHLVQMSKFHVDVAKVHPAAFVLLPDSINLARSYWGLLSNVGQNLGSHTPSPSSTMNEEENSCLEKLTLKGLLLLRACLKLAYQGVMVFKYPSPEEKEDRKKALAMMKSDFLSEGLVREMMEVLVIRFFVYRSQDLRRWEEQPEEFVQSEEESDVWEFSIRSCAERLYLDLIVNNKDVLVQPLLHVLATVATPQNTDVFLKDSIYTAVGLAAQFIHSDFDFDAFLSSTLVTEVQIQEPQYKILRRRIAILLAQWLLASNVKNRPLVYQVFQFLLDKSNDLNDQVVRITAAKNLGTIIDPFDFSHENFVPFAPQMLARLMDLIEEVDLGETKLAILHSVSNIVIRMELHIAPFANQLVSLLPPLWTENPSEFLIKQSILTLLTSLVNALLTESVTYHPIILPLIQSSVAPNSETRPFLLEDALELWAALLVQSPSSSPDLVSLAEYLFPIFDTAVDVLLKTLDIIESYILLAPTDMLAQSPRLIFSFRELLDGSTKREVHGRVTNLVEQLIMAADRHLNGQAGVRQRKNHVVDIAFLEILFKGLKSAHDAHQATGPKRPSTHVDGIIETDHLSILARLLLNTPDILVGIVACLEKPDDIFPAMHWLLTEWFSHTANIGSPTRKKLHCLGLTSLFSLAFTSPEYQKLLLGRLQEYMAFWTETILDICDIEEAGMEMGAPGPNVGNDLLISTDPDGGKMEGESAEEGRRRAMAFEDPVHRIDVKAFVREVLEEVVRGCGGQEVFANEWVVNVDGEVVKGFAQLGIL